MKNTIFKLRLKLLTSFERKGISQRFGNKYATKAVNFKMKSHNWHFDPNFANYDLMIRSFV